MTLRILCGWTPWSQCTASHRLLAPFLPPLKDRSRHIIWSNIVMIVKYPQLGFQWTHAITSVPEAICSNRGALVATILVGHSIAVGLKQSRTTCFVEMHWLNRLGGHTTQGLASQQLLNWKPAGTIFATFLGKWRSYSQSMLKLKTYKCITCHNMSKWCFRLGLGLGPYTGFGICSLHPSGSGEGLAKSIAAEHSEGLAIDMVSWCDRLRATPKKFRVKIGTWDILKQWCCTWAVGNQRCKWRSDSFNPSCLDRSAHHWPVNGQTVSVDASVHETIMLQR